jgi:membrane protein YqaA with SNARE-associated domain
LSIDVENTEVDALREPGAPGAKRALLKQGLFGLTLLLVAAAISSTLLRDLVETWGQAVVSRWGLRGIFVGVFLSDWSPLPLTNEPVMLLGLSGGMTFAQVLWVTSAASVMAGFAGYACGAMLGAGTSLRERFLAREGGRAAWVRRYGALGVAVAAFTPIPYALATWMAGLMRIPLPGFALACLVRIPKTLFYLWLLNKVWVSGGTMG